MRRPDASPFPVLLLVLVFACGIARSQTMEVTPSRVMADEPATVRVSGLEPKGHATIRAELTDGAGESWTAQAEFVADATGAVDTAKQAPVKGSYKTVSAMGPVWSMMPTAKDVHGYRRPQHYGSQTIDFHLVKDGKDVATAHLEQVFLREGVRQIRLEGELHGTLFLPAGDGPHPGVLVVGGSEGGLPVPKALWLANHCYAALALAYFRYETLPQELSLIPLEYFGKAIAWMKQRPEILPTEIGVMGTSRGGELAFQIGSIYPDIKAVVAYVPANVRYPACCGRMMGPAWTIHRQPLAYVIPMSRGPVRDPRQTMPATIAIEQTHGPILMLSGGEDGVWSSSEMTKDAMDRLKQAHFAFRYERLDYPHAGHRVGSPEIIPVWTGGLTQWQTGEPQNPGGSVEGNAESGLDATPKVLKFLEEALPTAH